MTLIKKKTLTIGIATYDREKYLIEQIKCIFDSKISDQVDILIVNDNPNKKIDEKIKVVTKNSSSFIVIEQKKNLGYANSFITLLRNCKTKYLLYNTDDDLILTENISELISYLSSNHIDLASTNYVVKDKVYRGRNKEKKIAIRKIGHATIHAPGIVYNTDTIMEYVDYIQSRVKVNCYAAKIYPQVLLSTLLVLNKHKCIWLPINTVVQYGNQPSQIKDDSGNTYFSLFGRINEYTSFKGFYYDIAFVDKVIQKENRIMAEILYTIQQQDMCVKITNAIKETSEEYEINNWDSRSLLYLLPHIFRTIPKSIFLVILKIKMRIKMYRFTQRS